MGYQDFLNYKSVQTFDLHYDLDIIIPLSTRAECLEIGKEIGILKVENQQVSFIHSLFAEFIVAKMISQNWRMIDFNGGNSGFII